MHSADNIVYLEKVDSTNAYIKRNIDSLSDRFVVTADLQISGKGRLGNEWLGERGMLPVSILFRNNLNPTRMTIISAVAVSRSIEKFSSLKANIKWTNDIICSGKKICGILCESVISSLSEKTYYIICGIGINVNQSKEYFEENSLPNASSICSLTGFSYDKNELLKTLLDELFLAVNRDFDDILLEYKRRLITLGREVKLIKNGEVKFAKAVDITSEGALICEDSSGRFTVNAGEVKIRTADGSYV